MKPIICIGMFVHNEEKHIKEAVDSILSQSYKDFRLIILDDCSIDKTWQIVQTFAKKDKRISLFKNNKRQGYIYNYIKTFTLAGDNVDYFAWAAGHDWYHPEWLETLIRVLQEHPKAIMAYPLTVRISEKDKSLAVASPLFDTVSLPTRDRMFAVCFRGEGFGNMIYGLFLTSAIRKARVFPSLLLPDVVLLTQLSLFGEFVQVKKKLWYRRFVGLFDIKRQMRNVFGKIPWYVHIPWPIINTIYLFRNTVLFPPSLRSYSRWDGFLITIYFFISHYPDIKWHYPSQSRILLLPYYVFMFLYHRNKLLRNAVLYTRGRLTSLP